MSVRSAAIVAGFSGVLYPDFCFFEIVDPVSSKMIVVDGMAAGDVISVRRENFAGDGWEPYTENGVHIQLNVSNSSFAPMKPGVFSLDGEVDGAITAYTEANAADGTTVGADNPVKPVAGYDVAEVVAGESVVIDVLTNDIDHDGTIDAATVVIVGQPEWGSAAVNTATGAVTYTPVAGFVGTDRFSYTVGDNDGWVSNPAVVDVTVSAAVVEVPGDEVLPSENLVKRFASGFENGTIINDRTATLGVANWRLEGDDESYNWVDDIVSIPESKDSFYGGGMFGNYEGAFASDGAAWAELVVDPDDAGNKVMKFSAPNPVWNAGGGYYSSTRVSSAISFNDLDSGLELFTEGKIKYRMRLIGFDGLESLSGSVDWLVIGELFEQSSPSCQTSRVSFSIHKSAGVGEPIYWALDGQSMVNCNSAGPFEWQEKNRAIAVPIDEWFTIGMYYKKGDATTGRVIVEITTDGGGRQTLFDVTGYTESPTNPDGYVSNWQMFKLYADGGVVNSMKDNGSPLEIYFDDFEYWSVDLGGEVVPPDSEIPTDISWEDGKNVSVSFAAPTASADVVGDVQIYWPLSLRAGELVINDGTNEATYATTWASGETIEAIIETATDGTMRVGRAV